MLTVLLAVCAAASNAFATVLQRRAAATAPPGRIFRIRVLVDVLRHPVWMLGMVAIIAGFLFQAAALHSGALALVQPVLVAELPLTLVLVRVLYGRRVEDREWVGVIGMSAGLALVLGAAAPHGGSTELTLFEGLAALIGCGGTVALLVLAALRRTGNAQAALLAGAAGTGFALTAALMKDATGRLSAGVGVVFMSWQVYAMALIGVGSFFIWQNALQAGSLAASQPVIVFTDPMVSMVLGVTLFGEHIRTGGWLVAQVAGAAVIVWASRELTTSTLLVQGDSAEGG